MAVPLARAALLQSGRNSLMHFKGRACGALLLGRSNGKTGMDGAMPSGARPRERSHELAGAILRGFTIAGLSGTRLRLVSP